MKEIACVKKYENETHYRFRACIAHEGLKTRDPLQITARITLSIHAIFVNVKKICKKCQISNFLNHFLSPYCFSQIWTLCSGTLKGDSLYASVGTPLLSTVTTI